jgi:hypothetical protein
MKRKLRILGVVMAALLMALAFVVVSRIRAFQTQSALVLTKTKLEVTRRACTSYFDYYGHWPESLSDLTHNRSNVVFVIWGEDAPNDGWGHPIQFSPFSALSGSGSVTSLGRDGRVGGQGPDADIEVSFGGRATN